MLVIICALVGTRDLGQEVFIALAKADTGRGIVAGLAIAFIAIIADRLITAAAHERQKEARTFMTELIDRIAALPIWQGQANHRAARGWAQQYQLRRPRHQRQAVNPYWP